MKRKRGEAAGGLWDGPGEYASAWYDGVSVVILCL